MLAKTIRAKLAQAGIYGLALAFLAAAPDMAAAGNHKNKTNGNAGNMQKGAAGKSDEELIDRAADVLTDAFLTDREKSILRDSFGGGRYPEGFKKPKPIPPGIQKKLARGGSLPPGIAMTRMPGTVQSRLPYRAGEEIIFIEDDAYLIQKSTQIILDVLNDVL